MLFDSRQQQSARPLPSRLRQHIDGNDVPQVYTLVKVELPGAEADNAWTVALCDSRSLCHNSERFRMLQVVAQFGFGVGNTGREADLIDPIQSLQVCSSKAT